MTEPLLLVALASELACELRKVTRAFPPEEDILMIPVLRDEALSVIENISLGMAGYSPIDRFRYLMRAKNHLDDFRNRIVVCRTTGLLPKEDGWELQRKYDTLKVHLIEMIKAVKGSIRRMSPLSPW